MISQKPYLIRAMYEWCQDNDLTPYIAVSTDENTIVPVEYIKDGQVVLNIATSATKNLVIDNQWITFQATFGGSIKDVAIPIGNVIAIFSRETNQGMQFEVERLQHQEKKKGPTSIGKLRLVE